jgi:4-amino-4-deoxy-L-arabinose transferase-like glycosyltransferase
MNLLWLGSAPLSDTTEARHAEVGREFVESGHWLVPTLFDRPHLTKPPLTDWLIAAGITIFGPNEFGARFFNALAAALTVSLAAGLAMRMAGARAGLLTTFFLLTSPVMLALARTISIDILLGALGAAALWAVWELAAGSARRKTASAIFFACLTLGIITKGHIALLLFVAPTALWIILGKRWLLARRLLWTPAVIGCLLLSPLWYCYIAWRFPGWLGNILSSEFSQRIIGDNYRHTNFGLTLVYFAAATVFFLPLLLGSLLERIKRIRKTNQETQKENYHAGLLVCWVLLPLITLCFVRCQRVNYIAPLIPMAAVLAALAWPRKWRKTAVRIGAAVFALLGLAFALFPLVRPCPSTTAMAIIVIAGVGMVISGTILTRHPQTSRWPILVGLAIVSFWLESVVHIENYKQHRSARSTCFWLKNNPPPADRIILYHESVPSAAFYLSGKLTTYQKLERPPTFIPQWPNPNPAIPSIPHLWAAANRPHGILIICDHSVAGKLVKWVPRQNFRVRIPHRSDYTSVVHWTGKQSK